MFLSAVLTQTWSAFAPILLDDPVTHFDDLNAYSFLDVIRGLIDEPGEGPQFIISTCEERLYRLMRQKFAQLNGKALFYEFSSIGDNGPKVERVLFN
jgi:exonuclease SbcC